MRVKNLRTFLQLLKNKKELLSIQNVVDPKFEVSELIRQADRLAGPALLFDRVKGFSTQIVGNLVGTKRRLALAFDLTREEKLLETYQKRRAREIQPKIVNRGPVKQVIIDKGSRLDLLRYPFPTYHEGDAGPYITCGIVIAKDPASRLRSMGLHRLQIKGPRKMGIHLTNPPIAAFAEEAERNGKPLEISVSVGVHPVILLASIVSSPRENKIGIASSLLGSPIEMVNCETVNADVPAHAEFVIEGKILPHVRELEGPFGETSGYYFSDKSHVVEVTAITHRREPILQILHPTVHEVTLLGGPAGEAEIMHMLCQKGYPIQSLSVSRASNRKHMVVSIRKEHDADPRQILYFLLSGVPYVKHVIVVDDDVDVHDPYDVEWAVATRFQGDKDLVCLPDLKARSVDPSKKEGDFMTKVGLDATAPLGEREKFQRISVPRHVREKIEIVVSQIFKSN